MSLGPRFWRSLGRTRRPPIERVAETGYHSDERARLPSPPAPVVPSERSLGRLPVQLGLGFTLAGALFLTTLDRAAAPPVGLGLAHIGIALVAGWAFAPAGRWATVGLAALAWTAADIDPTALPWTLPGWRGLARDGALRLATLATVTVTIGLARRAVHGVLRTEDTLAVTLLQERDSARRDRLTRLWNPRYLHEALDLEIARCRRYGRPFGLLVLDLDGFKAVNDTQGHAAGDLVLQAVGRVLHENCRINDVPARLGGDEFAVILPEASSLTVPRYAAKLVHLVARVPLPPGCPPITASIGGVAFERAPESAKAALAQADAVMYTAKREGKNRHAVTVAGATP
jgi:diguanylate cyclase (GGDEF)-like protein